MSFVVGICVERRLTSSFCLCCAVVLRDWKLLTNLLLMDKSSPDVSAEQQSILLAILIASIRKIIGEEDDQAPDKKSIAQERVRYCKLCLMCRVIDCHSRMLFCALCLGRNHCHLLPRDSQLTDCISVRFG